MDDVDLKDYLRVLWNKKWILVLTTFISIVMCGVISYFVLEPEYQTFATLMLGKPQNLGKGIEYSDILLNQKLVTTYREIAKSRIVSSDVIKNLDMDITHEALRKKVNVALIEGTEIIKITVNDSNPERAELLANEISRVFMENISRIMSLENVQVIDKAEIPRSPVKPRPVMNMGIGGVLGFVLGIVLILLVYIFDNRLKTPEDAEKHIGITVIGIIPEFSHGKRGGKGR